MLGVQSVKFLLPKGSRDGWQLCAVALLEFLAAAAGTDALAFALFAFLFFVASAGAMGALHDQEAEEAGRPSGGYAVPARAAAGVLLAAGVGGFLASAVLFAVIPRLEFRQVLERFGRARGVVGFSETITLREVTGIKSDPRVVARVEFPELRPGLLPANLYLRGAVYSRYEDGVWRHGGATPLPVQRAGFQHFVGDAAVPDSTADITLEAADHPALFTYGHPTLIEGAFAPVLSDGEGNLSLARSGHPTLRYRVRFAADLPRRPRIERRAGTEDLAFPEGYEDVRVLAREVAGGTGPMTNARNGSFASSCPVSATPSPIPPRRSGSSCSGSGPATASISPRDYRCCSAARGSHPASRPAISAVNGTESGST